MVRHAILAVLIVTPALAGEITPADIDALDGVAKSAVACVAQTERAQALGLATRAEINASLRAWQAAQHRHGIEDVGAYVEAIRDTLDAEHAPITTDFCASFVEMDTILSKHEARAEWYRDWAESSGPKTFDGIRKRAEKDGFDTSDWVRPE